MAIDPVFSPSILPEPAPQRSRASDMRDRGAEFTLPERRDDPPPPARDSGKAAAEPASKTDAPAKADRADQAATADGDKAPAKPSSGDAAQAKPTDATASKPAVSVAPDAASAQSALAANDIGALASILAAAETGKAGVAAPVQALATEAESALVAKPGKKKPEEETDAAAPAVPAAVQATPLSNGADLLALLAAGAAPVAKSAESGEAATAAIVSEETTKAPATAGMPVDPAAVLIKSSAAGAGTALVGSAGAASRFEAKAQGASAGDLPAAAQTAVTKLADAEPATTTGKPAEMRPGATLDPIAGAGLPSADAIKLPDNLQQALAPIDLSSLIQQASAHAPAHPLAATPPSASPLTDPGAATGQLPQAQAGASPPTPLHVVPIEIGMRALAGARSFDIRLDPAELGRVDVNLSISDKGEVSAKLVVDRVETLHLLQRDARTLERAFEQAGLKPSDSGVDISLRNDSGQAFRQQRQQDDAPQRQRRANQADEADTIGSVTAVAAEPTRQIMRLGGVDLSI